MFLPVWPSHRVTLQHTHVSTTNGYWSSSILNYHLTQSGHNGPWITGLLIHLPSCFHFTSLSHLSLPPFLPPSLFYSIPLSLPQTYIRWWIDWARLSLVTLTSWTLSPGTIVMRFYCRMFFKFSSVWRLGWGEEVRGKEVER